MSDQNSFVKCRGAVLFFGIVALGLTVIYLDVVTIANPAWRLSHAYPGAVVGLDWPSYTSRFPVLSDLVRRISSNVYIGPGEAAYINGANLPEPICLDALRGERIAIVTFGDSMIEDVSAMLPARPRPDIIFQECNFSRLPREQFEQLRKVWDPERRRYFYCLGNLYKNGAVREGGLPTTAADMPPQ